LTQAIPKDRAHLPADGNDAKPSEGIDTLRRFIGYTDDSGSERTNLKLSQERAEVVHRFLIDNGNLNIAIMAVGMGVQQSVDPLPDKSLRARSRFAGFELINDAGFRQGSLR
jgi:outer membrane protein OmpA-like peptidoglycan-associated protein